MSATGAPKRQPSSSRANVGTASRHHGSGAPGATRSRPHRIRTPPPGSPASALSTSNPRADQAATRSRGNARYGYQSAAATDEVVAGGASRATTSAGTPASRRRIAAVSPTLPRPPPRTPAIAPDPAPTPPPQTPPARN